MIRRPEPESDPQLQELSGQRLASTQHWQVTPEHEGRRLDNVLLRLGLPRASTYRLIRLGAVRVNGKKVKPEYRLVAGEWIRFPAWDEPSKDPVAGSYGRNVSPAQQKRKAQWIRELAGSRCVAKERDFILINKPAGLAVQGGTGLPYSLIELARLAFPEVRFLELVHRIDKETSGCLVLGTSLAFVRHFQQQITEQQVEKRYLCLVQGLWPRQRTELAGWLEGSELHRNSQNRWAETEVQLRKYYRGMSLLEVRPVTGRTHQLRIQLSQAGYPMAGDTRYGDRDFNRLLKTAGLKRLFLHAQGIDFLNVDQHRYRFQVPLESDLERVLQGLA
ncbi:MAG: pseudouridine synthase [Gammaproteobacteria bacterium]